MHAQNKSLEEFWPESKADYAWYAKLVDTYDEYIQAITAYELKPVIYTPQLFETV